MKSSHQTKSKKELRNFILEINSNTDEPTKKEKGDSTLDKAEPDKKNKPTSKKRKFPNNRLYKHIKTHWPGYLIGGLFTISLIFVGTFGAQIEGIRTDIKHINDKVDTNANRVDKLSDEIISVREQVLVLDGKLNSLDARFAMFIELFRRNNNEPLNQGGNQ